MTLPRRFVRTSTRSCDWCNGTGLGGDWGGGPCYGCNGGTLTFEELDASPADADLAAFAGKDLAAAEAHALEALARAAAWTGSSFAAPIAVTWRHDRIRRDAAWRLSSSCRAAIARLELASGAPLPRFDARIDLLRAASAAYASLGDVPDPFAPHLALFSHGIALVEDAETLELVV